MPPAIERGLALDLIPLRKLFKVLTFSIRSRGAEAVVKLKISSSIWLELLSLPLPLAKELFVAAKKFEAKYVVRRRNWVAKDIPVLPFVELLELWRGGSIYRGGPQAVTATEKALFHHWRGQIIVSDPIESARTAQLRSLPGRFFWCGPICDHFGHMVGEFSGRILASSLDSHEGTLIFAAKEGEHRDWKNLKTWQRSLISYLNPANKPVFILKEPALVEEIVAIPSQQRLMALPTAWQLAALGYCSRRYIHEPIPEPIVLSRARHASCTNPNNLLGSFAGEAALDSLLARHGARVVYPELLSLEEQLRITMNARRLVVSEGSALHGLELLGWRPHTQLVVIARRPRWPDMDLPLRARFGKMQWIDAVQELLWLPPANPRVKGLARLDTDLLLDQLEDCLGMQFSHSERLTIHNAAARQIDGLTSQLQLKRDCSPPRQPLAQQSGW